MSSIHSVRHAPWALFVRQFLLFNTLSKGRLSFSVALSSLFGYLFASPSATFTTALLLFVGGLLVAAGAGTFNQWMERDDDRHMHRTQGRPLPAGTLTPSQAIYWGVISSGVGLLLLYFGTNPLVALLSLLSLLLYVWGYTPLKRKGPIAVIVGALPGAMPPLLGCVAAEGYLTEKGILLFGIQFIWQFPHFWAIAWVANQDYTRAGFKLLPSSKQGFRTALFIVLYALFLLPIGLLPTYFDHCGLIAACVAFMAGLLLLVCAVRLLCTLTNKAASQVMWASLIYLPFVQLAYVLDRL